MNNIKYFKGYFFAILSAVIYGAMPLMSKLIYADGVNPVTLVFLRNFLSLPVMAILAYSKQKTLKIPLKSFLKIIPIAVMGCCVTPFLLFTSYNYIDSGIATILHFIYPAIVLILGIIFLHKKIQLGNILSVIICFVGICFFYNPSESFNLTGGIIALLSGVAFAIYIIILSDFDSSDMSIFLFSFYVALISGFVMFGVCVSTNSLALPKTFYGFILCVIFALAITVGAVVLFQQSTFIIGGERTSILSTLEPITSVVIGAVILKEYVGFKTIIGSVLVVLASLLITVFDIKNKQE